MTTKTKPKPRSGKIRTIEELLSANENDFEMVKHYMSQVTVSDDLSEYLQWLHDNEIETKVITSLRRDRKREAGIHPSSACKKGVCLLKLHYECTFEVEPGAETYDEKMQITWDLGTLLHDTYQTWFTNMYEGQFKKEVPLVDKDLFIKSHTDGIFDFTNYRFILEMKSIKEGGNYGWEKVQAKPFDDHVRQSHFYMKLANIPFTLIFYMNKNAGLFKEHAVAFNPIIWEEMNNGVIAPVIESAYNGGPRVDAKPGWDCRYCKFQSGCPAKADTTGDTSNDWQ